MSRRSWDGWSLFLIGAALFVVGIRLVLTRWTDHLDLVLALALLGTGLGTVLGISRFAPWAVTLLASAYGAVALPWRLALTLGRELAWRERWEEVLKRLVASVAALAARQPVEDPLFFLALVSGLGWALGVHAGYALARRSASWRALLPPGVALLLVQIYDPVPSRAGYLAAYLFILLLLVAHQTYRRCLVRWHADRVLVPPYFGLDWSRVAWVVAVLLVLLAWSAPALARALPPAEEVWRRVDQAWEPVRDHLSRAFAAVRSTVGIVTESFGERFSLGHGQPLSGTPIMRVHVPPYDMGVRYYWRARTYDRYADGMWTTTITTTHPVTPDLLTAAFSELEGRVVATFTFTTALPALTLYVPPDPLWVGHPAQATLAFGPDGTVDLVTLEATPYLRAGESYQVRAALDDATVAQLREAGVDYPPWIVERYLQLPPDITPRTRRLAFQLAEGLGTPYDVAAAVTRYLRDHIKYRDSVPAPPRGQEVMDWLLFDLREGFCSYYATAEVVLLRVVGIPARLAVGYARGERIGEGLYRVRQRNRHAWPEVYFPGFGWVAFEPTASQPPIDRPWGETPTQGRGRGTERGGGADEAWRRRLEELLAMEEELPPERPSPPVWPAGPVRRPWTGLLVGGSLLLALVLIRVLRRRTSRPLPVLLEAGLRRLGVPVPPVLERWAQWAALPPLLRAYGEINRALARLGAPPASAETPAERVARLTHLIPQAAPYLHRLLVEYQVTVYGMREGNPWVAQRSAQMVRTLSWRARLRRLWLWRYRAGKVNPEGE